jgi:lipoyl synthase
MLMGDVCTRACRFCAVDTGNPNGWLDPEEPRQRGRIGAPHGPALRGADLGGPGRPRLTAAPRTMPPACAPSRRVNPRTAVEALTPDFRAARHVETVVDSGLEVFAQNLETVRRLTHPVRDPRASYEQTLDVLAHAKAHRPGVLTKTSLMLGLGETDDEIRRPGGPAPGSGWISSPSASTCAHVNHLPVERFVTPEQFAEYRGGAGHGISGSGLRAAGPFQLPADQVLAEEQRGPGRQLCSWAACGGR